MAGPVVVAAAVVIEGDRVLLTQRPGGTHLAGAWEFPGGKLEEHESPEVALVRELREELGVESEVGEVLDVTWWRYPTKSVLLLFYRARITRGEIAHLGVAAHVWAKRDELSAFEFPAADLAVLGKIRALLGE
jgi:8-oxo-dGTP diphosphatase